jgi:protein-disulfide isomerase
VAGVPTFYANDLVVVGCQPYETLEKFVKHLLAQNNTAR